MSVIPARSARSTELDEETRNDPLYFPDISGYRTETFQSLPQEINQYYNDLWVDILT